MFQRAAGLREPLPPVPVSTTWHSRTDRDPLYQWLRAQVVGSVTALG
ncbi:MAG: hypothetical protein ABMA64_22320 [Myxococcota bacterium]